MRAILPFAITILVLSSFAGCDSDDDVVIFDERRIELFCEQREQCTGFPSDYGTYEECMDFETEDNLDIYDYQSFGGGECVDELIRALDCKVRLSCDELENIDDHCPGLWDAFSACENQFYS